MIRFVELVGDSTRKRSFALGEVWINDKYVVKIKEATGYSQMLKEGLLPPDLDTHHEFTAVTVNNGSLTETHVVIGSVPFVASRLSGDRKTLLKG